MKRVGAYPHQYLRNDCPLEETGIPRGNTSKAELIFTAREDSREEPIPGISSNTSCLPGGQAGYRPKGVISITRADRLSSITASRALKRASR